MKLTALTVAILICSLVEASSAESGVASVYGGNGDRHAYKPTAHCYVTARRKSECEKMDPRALTAAHKTLPFGTMVKVTNKKNGRTVVVRINDRGPFIRGRIIDLTPAGAQQLGFSGLASVTLSVL